MTPVDRQRTDSEPTRSGSQKAPRRGDSWSPRSRHRPAARAVRDSRRTHRGRVDGHLIDAPGQVRYWRGHWPWASRSTRVVAGIAPRREPHRTPGHPAGQSPHRDAVIAALGVAQSAPCVSTDRFRYGGGGTATRRPGAYRKPCRNRRVSLGGAMTILGRGERCWGCWWWAGRCRRLVDDWGHEGAGHPGVFEAVRSRAAGGGNVAGRGWVGAVGGRWADVRGTACGALGVGRTECGPCCTARCHFPVLAT